MIDKISDTPIMYVIGFIILLVIAPPIIYVGWLGIEMFEIIYEKYIEIFFTHKCEHNGIYEECKYELKKPS